MVNTAGPPVSTQYSMGDQSPVTPVAPAPELSPNTPIQGTPLYAPARMPLTRMAVPGTAVSGSPGVGTLIINQREIGFFARSLIVLNTSGSTLSLDSMQGWQIPATSNPYIVRCAPALGWLQISVAVSSATAGNLWIIATEEDLAPISGGNSAGGGTVAIAGPLGSQAAAASLSVVNATPQNNAAARTSVPNSATQVGATHATRANMLVKNTDAALTIDVGFSNAVTSGGGFPLKPGESASFSGPQIWAIASAAGPVSVAYFDSWF